MRENIFGRKRNKGSTIINIILIAVAIFALAVTFLIASKFNNIIKEVIEDDSDLSSQQQNLTIDRIDNVTIMSDYGFLLFVIALHLIPILLSFQVNIHPAFYWISIILLILVAGIFVSLSNAYEDLATSDSFSTEADNLPIMSFLMPNFTIIIIIFSILTFTIAHAKTGGYG